MIEYNNSKKKLLSNWGKIVFKPITDERKKELEDISKRLNKSNNNIVITRKGISFNN
ncbi:hypothetical protein [Companilactobacillus sp. HBUAS56275]|jgi:hypothetical protein|uniref:Uncharacterized protein n=1 Tax=Candidatus Companilactobacillus pullicola TaxID=2838523 RepID=A0A9D1ZPV1_9LACO|nr:hypothetical protein [Candidatus Companilactobacillus pullicola]